MPVMPPVPSTAIRALNSSPFWLNTNEPQTVVTLAAYQSAGPIVMAASNGGNLLIKYFGGTFTDRCKIRMYRQGLAFQNTDLLVKTIFSGYTGNSDFRMFRLNEPILLTGLDALEVYLSDDSGAENAITITHQASRFSYMPNDEELAQLGCTAGAHCMFYTLDEGSVEVASGQTVEKFITISNEHTFQIISKVINFENANLTGQSFKIDIVDTATGDSFLYAPAEKHYATPAGFLFGSEYFPNEELEPITAFPGMKLKVTITNSSAYDDIVDLTLCGRAIPNGRAV